MSQNFSAEFSGEKGSDERRIIMDLSFPPHNSVNSQIEKEIYLGENIDLKYPSVDALCEKIVELGPGCHLFKRELKRAYRQIPIFPGDYHKVGFRWKGKTYMDWVLGAGLRSAAYICQ